MSLIDLYSRISVSRLKFKKGTWQLQLPLQLFLLLSVCVNCVHSQSFSRYDKHVAIIQSWVGQTETKGNNRSPLIDSMNRYVGSGYGNPYCAATVCYGLYKSGKPVFKTALARNLRNKDTFTSFDVIMGNKKILRGDILIWQKGETVNGHTETATENWNGVKGKTVGGNTSSSDKGSQSDGGGFWNRTRKIEPTSYFRIKWITPIRK